MSNFIFLSCKAEKLCVWSYVKHRMYLMTHSLILSYIDPLSYWSVTNYSWVFFGEEKKQVHHQ